MNARENERICASLYPVSLVRSCNIQIREPKPESQTSHLCSICGKRERRRGIASERARKHQNPVVMVAESPLSEATYQTLSACLCATDQFDLMSFLLIFWFEIRIYIGASMCCGHTVTLCLCVMVVVICIRRCLHFSFSLAEAIKLN